MWKTAVRRGMIAVALALVAVVLGLTQPLPAGAQDGTTVTTEDPFAATDPFGDDVYVTSPSECFENTTATVPEYGLGGWTCAESSAAAYADTYAPEDDSPPGWAIALKIGGAVCTAAAALGRRIVGRG